MGTTVKKVGNLSVKVITGDTSFGQDNSISESDAEMDYRATAAVRSAIDKAKICKKPIAKYDTVTKKAYLEYADGKKQYVN
jgi:hypothetical protein